MLNALISRLSDKSQLPNADQALPGRSEAIQITDKHYVNGHSLKGPFPEQMETAIFAMGCFWGAERCFWTIPGVYSTSVGYIAGFTPNPSYYEVCTGRTGHTEAVQVIFDPSVVSYQQLLKHFWESHNPTQGMRQGNDQGTQYRSGIYPLNEQQTSAAEASKQAYGQQLKAAGHGSITTEIQAAGEYYFAEDEHQQYLGKNVNGYCGLGGTGVGCPG